MKMKVMGVAMAASLFGAIGCSAQQQQESATVEPAKILIAYYSWGGNTKAGAEQIQKQTGGELFEIKPVTPYPTEYRECTEKAKKDIADGVRPELATKIEDIKKYDVIFVGSPNWWGTIAPPVATFLSSYDFEGKTIIPFFTHGGGGMQNCEKDVRKLCEKFTVLKAATFSGGSMLRPSTALEAWVSKSVTLKK